MEDILKHSHSRYSYNSKDNILTIGTVKFYFIAIEQPGNIYAYNLNIFLCDEIDELSQQKVLEANTVIRERTRILLPDGLIPYIMYFTTVQGYRGLYNVVQTLKKAKQKYVLVRGETRNNTMLSPSYIKSLYGLQGAAVQTWLSWIPGRLCLTWHKQHMKNGLNRYWLK